jgi:hypothetical protein
MFILTHNKLSSQQPELLVVPTHTTNNTLFFLVHKIYSMREFAAQHSAANATHLVIVRTAQ